MSQSHMTNYNYGMCCRGQLDDDMRGCKSETQQIWGMKEAFVRQEQFAQSCRLQRMEPDEEMG